jgi:WD40 repeat protein
VDPFPDRRHILIASADRTARIWDAASGVCLHTLSHRGPVYWAAIGYNTVLTADNRGVHL